MDTKTSMKMNIKSAKRGLVATLQPKPAEDWKKRKCGECKWGEYIDIVHSRTTDGKPFLKKCGFATWGRHTSGERITLDSCQACNQFAERNEI